MTVIYGEEDAHSPIRTHKPDTYEIDQASFAAEFNERVIAAQRAQLASDDDERARVRKALAGAPIVQSLAGKLAHTDDDVRVISAQQSAEEFEQVRAGFVGG